jgi:hypothetical protein
MLGCNVRNLDRANEESITTNKIPNCKLRIVDCGKNLYNAKKESLTEINNFLICE